VADPPSGEPGIQWLAATVMEDLGEGAHVAVLYAESADRDAYLLPYLRSALREGDGGVCVTAVDPDDLIENVRIGSAGSGDFEVVGTTGSYLRDGAFRGEAMVSWLSALAAEAPAGSDRPRRSIAGDLNWLKVLDDKGLRELFAYESALDSLAPGCRHTFACFYDTTQLPARNVIDVFRTHSRVVVGGALWNSPFYRSPELSDAGQRGRGEKVM
jgi:DcmR-like sensory protein